MGAQLPIRVRIPPVLKPADPQEVQMQTADGFIQYRIGDNGDWLNIIALDDLLGPAGPAVELRSNGTYIQYRPVGTTDWFDIVLLLDLVGPPPSLSNVNVTALGANDAAYGDFAQTGPGSYDLYLGIPVGSGIPDGNKIDITVLNNATEFRINPGSVDYGDLTAAAITSINALAVAAAAAAAAGVTVTNGDKGDVTFAGGNAASVTIDAKAVTDPKVNDLAITARSLSVRDGANLCFNPSGLNMDGFERVAASGSDTIAWVTTGLPASWPNSGAIKSIKVGGTENSFSYGNFSVDSLAAGFRRGVFMTAGQAFTLQFTYNQSVLSSAQIDLFQINTAGSLSALPSITLTGTANTNQVATISGVATADGWIYFRCQTVLAATVFWTNFVWEKLTPSDRQDNICATRTIMKSRSTRRNSMIYLAEAGREGWFTFTAGNFSTQVAADTLEGIYIKADDTAASSGAWVRVYDGPVVASWWGSTQAGINQAHLFSDDIIIDTIIPIIGTSAWPNGKRYHFSPPGELAVANAVTLTIRGVVDAQIRRQFVGATVLPYKIFNCTGTGAVVGVRQVYPEWWGAVGDVSLSLATLTGTDNKPALQAAINCIAGSVSSDGEAPEILLSGSYGIGSGLVLSPVNNFHPIIRGATPLIGGRITVLASFSGGSVAFQINGQAGTTLSVAGFELSNFALRFETYNPPDWNSATSYVIGDYVTNAGSSYRALANNMNVVPVNGATWQLISTTSYITASDAGCTTGLAVGDTTNYLQPSNGSLIHGMDISGFQFPCTYQNARKTLFKQVSMRSGGQANSRSLSINGTATQFTGDVDFENCQFEAQNGVATSRCVQIAQTNAYAPMLTYPNAVSGIRFSGCIFYYGNPAFLITASSGADIHDIFVQAGCQFDGSSTGGIQITATGSNTDINAVSIIGCWINGSNSASSHAVLLQATSSGKLKRVVIKGNHILGPQGSAVRCEGAEGVEIDGNIIHNNDNAAGSSLLILSPSLAIGVTNNKMTRSASQTCTNMVSIQSGVTDYVVMGNIKNGCATNAITDSGGAVTKYVPAGGNI